MSMSKLVAVALLTCALASTSRAGDEAGNSQPLRADFIAQRGQSKTVPNVLGFPNNHYNSLTSWGVDAKGEIKHVYV